MTVAEELIRGTVTCAVYVALNMNAWRNVDHYHAGRPLRCALTGMVGHAAGMLLGGYQVYVHHSIGAAVGMVLGDGIGDYLSARNRKRNERPDPTVSR